MNRIKINGRRYLRFDPAGIPSVLREHPHWLVCDHTGRPVSRGEAGDSKTNPDHWVDFATGCKIVAAEPGLWPYIVLTEENTFTIIDVDFKPRKDDETEAQYEARIERATEAMVKLRKRFPRRYEAKSKSGNGFHITVNGKFEGTGGKGKGEWSEVEIYTRKHGVALTGHVVDGSTDPGVYQEEIQSLRDEIKGTRRNGAESGTNGSQTSRTRRNKLRPVRDHSGANCRNGTVRIEFARKVLAELKLKFPSLDYPDWRDITSAVCDGLGEEVGTNLMKEFWPPKNPWEYDKLTGSLTIFIPWDTLRKYGVDPVDPEALLDLMPNLEPDSEPEPVRFPPIVTGAEMQRLYPAPPPEVIRGVIGEGEKLLFSGTSKGMKTFGLLQLAAAVQTGGTWFGFECVQGDVLFVNFEFSPQRLKQRVEKIAGAGEAHFLNLRGYKVKWPNLRKYLQSLRRRFKLIIVDPIYKMLHGANENDNSEIADLLHELEVIAKEMGAATAFSHHFSKGSKAKVAQIDRASGAGVWARDPDAIITLTDHETDNCLILEASLRHYKAPPPSVWTFAYPNFVEVEGADPKAIRGTARSDKMGGVNDVLAILSDGPLSKKELSEALGQRLGCGDKTARRRIKEAEAFIEEREDGTYALPPDTSPAPRTARDS